MSSSHAFSPMDQFKIERYFDLKLFGYDIGFTNSAFVMMAASLIICIFFTIALWRYKSESKMQRFALMVYNFAEGIAKNAIGEHGYQKYAPLIISLFFYICLLNFDGMVIFSPTAHISMTIPMGIVVFLVCIITSIRIHGFRYFSIFIPKGVPILIAPIIFIIEFASYLSRPVSLGVRLAANIIAGHVMLIVIGSFIEKMGGFGVIPGILVGLFSIVECLVGILQAYIFCILSSTYISESLHH